MKKTSHLIVALAIFCASSRILMPIDSTAKTSTALKADKKEVDTQLKQLKQQLKTMNDQFDTYIDTYDTLQQDIEDIEASIEVAEADLTARKKIIAERMKAYQAQDSTMSPYVEAILGADSLTDLVTRTLSVKKIIDADEGLRDQQKKETKQLKVQRDTLLEKQAELDRQFQMMQEAYEALVVKRTENKAKSLKLKEKIATTEEKEKIARQRKKAERKLAAMKKAQKEQAAAIKKAKEAQEAAQAEVAKQKAAAEAAQKAQAAAEAKAAEAAAKNEEVTTQTSDVTTEADTNDTPSTSATTSNAETSTTTTANTSTENVTGSTKAQAIIAEARKYLGRKYVWGGSTPTTGFDCSGLTSWSFKQNGITIPRTSAQQYAASTKINASEAKAGDLVFFSYGKGVAHVGIYLGDGRMIHASNSGLQISELAGYWNKYLVGYGRFAGVN
ncbi:C40 family peptidase [Kurthia massiliensis]|uniref:C40 family peptidase n=1 Tax=Kurthia massiliensis TaxID=1033739 RepID=UPI0002891BA3|nr:NlpC/P60 family protein [Kurthia massiliensis]